MSAATIALGVFGGAAAMGVLWYAVRKSSPATPAAQAAPSAGSITLVAGPMTVAVKTGTSITLVPPAGASITNIETTNNGQPTSVPVGRPIVINGSQTYGISWVNASTGASGTTTLVVTAT